MKLITTKTHALMDYLSGLVMVVSPWLFGFATGGPAQIVMVFAGVLVLAMAVFTDYEGGVVRVIPMGFHLTMDVVLGVLLVLSPWLLGFYPVISWPHVLFGLLEAGAGFATFRVPGYRKIAH